MKNFHKLIIGFFIYLFLNSLTWAEFSLGVVLGEPTGLSLKIQQKKTLAHDIALNFNTADNYLYLSWDVLKYDYTKITSKELSGSFPIFYGLGLRAINYSEDLHLAIRFILGLEYIFADIPFNIFVKLAPTINLVPHTRVSIAPAIGIRYIFK
ncbi:MAG: hypothetical protein ABDH23_04695 [Endomicrobiia bacterium]